MKVLPYFGFWGTEREMVESGLNDIANLLKARNGGIGDGRKLACPLFSRHYSHAAAYSPHHKEHQ